MVPKTGNARGNLESCVMRTVMAQLRNLPVVFRARNQLFENYEFKFAFF